jgi:DNA polymerase-3 subunit alpha
MLRRIIGRKQTDKIEKAMGEFCDLGIKNGISQEVIKQISEQIITFAKYGFNQGHSTAYGYIAYQTAYLKAHYPVQFMCSLINSKATEEVPGQVEECKRLGIQILPPDIRIGNTSWTMESGGIRVGISYIKFVGNAGVEYCSSFESFINTNTCNKRVIEYLIKSGAMDCYGNRALRLKDLCKINEEIASINAKITANREKITRINEKLNTTKDTTKAFQTLLTQLDNREMDIVKLNQKLKEVKELGKSLERYDEITGEVEALGFSLRDKNLYYDFSIAKRFNEDLHMPQIIGGDIVNLKEIKTRYGKPMAFVGIKTCFNESLEFAVFDKVLAKSNLMVGRTYLFAIEREGDKFRIADVRLPKRI